MKQRRSTRGDCTRRLGADEALVSVLAGRVAADVLRARGERTEAPRVLQAPCLVGEGHRKLANVRRRAVGLRRALVVGVVRRVRGGDLRKGVSGQQSAEGQSHSADRLGREVELAPSDEREEDVVLAVELERGVAGM